MRALHSVKPEACHCVAPDQRPCPVISEGPEESRLSCQLLEASFLQNVAVTVRRPGQEALLLGTVLPLHAPGNVPSRPQVSCPPSSFLPPDGATCSQQVRAPRCPGPEFTLHTPRPGHFSLLLSLQLCPQQDITAACLTTVSLRCGHLLLVASPFSLGLTMHFPKINSAGGARI